MMLTFVRPDHSVRLDGGILDTVVVLQEECLLMLEEVINILYSNRQSERGK